MFSTVAVKAIANVEVLIATLNKLKNTLAVLLHI